MGNIDVRKYSFGLLKLIIIRRLAVVLEKYSKANRTVS